MKVIVKAKSGDGYIGEDFTKIEGDALRIFDGVDCQDCFTDYMDKIDGVSGGYMEFRFEDGVLNVYTEYDSTRELTKEECEKLINGYTDRPKITELEQRAYYRPSTDEINMPKMGSFDSVDSYYATLFHKLVHSSGHPRRLDRQGISKGYFGDEIYSTEELVAEFGATFLCGLAGIEQNTIQNATAYIKNWIKKLQDKPQIAVQAAQTASRAVDYICGIKRKEYDEVAHEKELECKVS
jgi:antirestriction protein ArdC